MKILAIDQATHCGWCVNGISGVWDFSTKKDESTGSKMLRFRAKLREVCELEKIELIVYERVAGLHKSSIIHAAKMVAIIETFCEENNIHYAAFSAKEIKSFATGKGNAGKPAMIEAAKQKYGFSGDDDNEADALHLYHLALQHYAPQNKQLNNAGTKLQ